MPEERELWVAIKADTTAINSKLDELTGRMVGSVQKAQNPILGILGKIGIAIGIAFSVKKIIDFGYQSITAFSNAEKSVLRLNNTLRNLGISPESQKSIEGILTTLSGITAFSTTDIRSALEDMTMRFGNADIAVKGLYTAMEVARGQGTNLAEAGFSIGQAMMGTARYLKQFGIETIKDKTDMQILDMILNKQKGNMESYSGAVGFSTEKLALSFRDLKEAVGKNMAESTKYVSTFFSSMLISMTATIGASSQVSADLDQASKSGIGFAEKLKAMWYLASEFFLAIRSTITVLPLLWEGLKNVFNPEKAKIIADKVNAIYTGMYTDWEKGWEDKTMVAQDALVNLGSVGVDAMDTFWTELTKYLSGIRGGIDDTANSMEKLWKPISIVGGNVPELVKFVGSLRGAVITTIRKAQLTVDINVHTEPGTPTGEKPTTETKKVAKAIGYVAAKLLREELQEGYVSHGILPIGGGR
jgi:hypothetical protein